MTVIVVVIMRLSNSIVTVFSATIGLRGMSLRRPHTKCPKDIVARDAADALGRCQASLSPAWKRFVRKQDCINYNFRLPSYDKGALFEFKGLLRELIMINGAGVFTKNLLIQGLTLFDSETGSRSVSAKHAGYVEKQAYAISHMFHVLRDIKKNTRVDNRLPAFLFDLVGLLDTQVGATNASELSPAPNQRADSNDLASAWRDRDSPMEQKHKLLTSSSRPEKRRQILRRVTSSASHCSTVHWSQSDIKAEVPSISGLQREVGMCWYDEAYGVPRHLFNGVEETANPPASHSSVFLLFAFPSGHQWISEIPALLHSDAHDPDAANAIQKKTSGPTAEADERVASLKIRKSRAYHAAEREYKRYCKVQGVDRNIMKQRARCNGNRLVSS